MRPGCEYWTSHARFDSIHTTCRTEPRYTGCLTIVGTTDRALPMTYEEYLDEVTTLLTEIFNMSDEDAIKHVMRAQAADYFTLHDDLPEMRTQERALQDAKTIFKEKNKSRPHVPPKRTGKSKK
jgi:hypothetical protein